MIRPVLRLSVVAAAALLCAAPPARAAETYHTCTGFITSLPAVIGTQGTWCLRQDFSVPFTSGNTIQVTASNITIDCNGFKIGNTSAGLGTAAKGIVADGVNNVTVRNCNLRGFTYPVYLVGANAFGHTVEDNRIDGATKTGIYLEASASVIRRNRVLDTGGTTDPASSRAWAIGVFGTADIVDNTIDGVDPDGLVYANGSGIFLSGGFAARIARNQVRSVYGANGGAGAGITLQFAVSVLAEDNLIQADNYGIDCSMGTSIAIHNTIHVGDTAVSTGCGGTDNYIVD